MHDNLKRVWKAHVRAARDQTLSGTVLSAFNICLDVMVHLDGPTVKHMVQCHQNMDLQAISTYPVNEIESINTKEEFIAVLIDCLRSGKSMLMMCDNPHLFTWFEEQFPNRKERLGGQAGIMAQQLVSLNATSVLYSPVLSQRQATVLAEEMLFPIGEGGKLTLQSVNKAAKEDDDTLLAWVFEYGGEEEFDFGFTQVVTNRANRIIVALRPKGMSMNFQPEFHAYLEELGRSIDLAMVAGYSLGGPNPSNRGAMREYFKTSNTALARMRGANPHLKIHLEYIPMKEVDMEAEMLRTMTKYIDSFGINEIEVARVLSLFGEEQLAADILENEGAYSLYRGGLALMRSLNIRRLHIHNLGYYVLIIKKPYHVTAEKVRQACLYGSNVNACKALHGGYPRASQVREMDLPISDVGIEQLRDFAVKIEAESEECCGLEHFLTTGILEYADHYVVIVPTHVVQNPVATVGMGDTISVSCYAMEVIGTDT